MEIIEDLLRIKKFREQKAELALAKARSHLALAVTALKQARDALAACELSCDQRQRALYADLMSRLVVRADIDAVVVDVEEMKKEIQAAEEVVQNKKTARDEAEKQLEQARAHHHVAMRGREKFTELSLVAGRERLALVQRKEDLELEEAKTAARVGSESSFDDGHGDNAFETAQSPQEDRAHGHAARYAARTDARYQHEQGYGNGDGQHHRGVELGEIA